MGRRNYLVDGVSCAGKTTVCRELRHRGHHAINGDTELAYQGDPVTGEPLDGLAHEHHLWDVEAVRAAVADRTAPASFFCGGCRNLFRFVDAFDEIFVPEIDRATLVRRLAARPPSEWGGRSAERALVMRLQATRKDLPDRGVGIDATAPIERVVDELLERCRKSAG